ncbi:MAG: SIS domain-containing protein [Fidelibacterota bacterium]
MTHSRRIIEDQLRDSARVIRAMITPCSGPILTTAEVVIEAVKNGGKVLWCGNGGSAAQAQHLSTELVGGLRHHGRPPVASVSLTTDSSLLTAWSNDMDFETVFSRQVEALGEKGDVLMAISTSGNSPNVVRAAETARKRGIKTVVFTGEDGGRLKEHGDIVIQIPSADTQRIQEGHIAAGHIICDLVEQAFL